MPNSDSVTEEKGKLKIGDSSYQFLMNYKSNISLQIKSPCYRLNKFDDYSK